MSNFDWWPLMLKSNHDMTRRENGALREALKAANAELRQHRLLLGNLRAGDEETTRKVAEIFKRASA